MEALAKLTVVKLRAALKKKGLPTGGRKAELVSRLASAGTRGAPPGKVAGGKAADGKAADAAKPDAGAVDATLKMPVSGGAAAAPPAEKRAAAADAQVAPPRNNGKNGDQGGKPSPRATASGSATGDAKEKQTKSAMLKAKTKQVMAKRTSNLKDRIKERAKKQRAQQRHRADRDRFQDRRNNDRRRPPNRGGPPPPGWRGGRNRSRSPVHMNSSMRHRGFGGRTNEGRFPRDTNRPPPHKRGRMGRELPRGRRQRPTPALVGA